MDGDTAAGKVRDLVVCGILGSAVGVQGPHGNDVGVAGRGGDGRLIREISDARYHGNTGFPGQVDGVGEGVDRDDRSRFRVGLLQSGENERAVDHLDIEFVLVLHHPVHPAIDGVDRIGQSLALGKLHFHGKEGGVGGHAANRALGRATGAAHHSQRVGAVSEGVGFNSVALAGGHADDVALEVGVGEVETFVHDHHADALSGRGKLADILGGRLPGSSSIELHSGSSLGDGVEKALK